jgi:hypothetical protein
MIRCQLTQITRNQHGQAIRQERQVHSDVLSIGRGAECKIRLPDHRISLHQASIEHGDDGRLYIISEGSRLFEIDGHMVAHTALTPGVRIVMGPYAIVVTAMPSNDEISLDLEQTVPAESTVAPVLAVTLAGTGLSIRKPALWLAGLITLLFIALPIAYSLHPGFHQFAQKYHLIFDEPLNAGNMSPGHRALSMKCDTCHQTPFAPVSNQACENCHKAVAHHIPDPILHSKVFSTFRCSSCHLDHRGRIGLIRHDTQQCVECHGNIKKHHAETRLSNIHDFSVDHPTFQLTFKSGPDSQDKRVRQNDKAQLVEHSGIKFSHQEHFDKALIELPGDKTRDIDCADCHVPTEAGTGFEPMSMPLTCQQSKCHSLELTPPIEGRKVPHASEKVVMTMLRELFTSRAVNQVAQGSTALADIKLARAWAERETNRNAVALFTKEEEGTCLECHEITQDPANKEASWKVAPVRITEHWLPKAHFPHDKHNTVKCTSCHDVLKSDKSSDVAIPTIAKCRECHVGSKETKTRVSSTCDTCHNFHDVRAQTKLPAAASNLNED